VDEMKKKRVHYKGFLIEYGNFYESGERWYTWNTLAGDENPFDKEHKGYETLKEAKAAVDEYKKAPR
jgi:hypothetical protein